MLPSDRSLITTGTVGAILAAICCTTPILAIMFGALGVTAGLAHIDYLVIAALIICLGLIAFGLYRRRCRLG